MSSTRGRYFEIVHTPYFEASAKGVLSVEQVHEIEVLLATTPEGGAVIRETSGVRKVRVALPGRGKRGGARVIYYAHLPCEKVYLLFVYAKNERENLTETQTRVARQLATMIQKEGC
jgi:hypothetical protein